MKVSPDRNPPRQRFEPTEALAVGIDIDSAARSIEVNPVAVDVQGGRIEVMRRDAGDETTPHSFKDSTALVLNHRYP